MTDLAVGDKVLVPDAPKGSVLVLSDGLVLMHSEDAFTRIYAGTYGGGDTNILDRTHRQYSLVTGIYMGTIFDMAAVYQQYSEEMMDG